MKWVALLVGLFFTARSLAGIDPQAELGDALFRDAAPGQLFSHAAIYCGCYVTVWSNAYRHAVIQASGYDYNPTVGLCPFDYSMPGWPTFMNDAPSNAYLTNNLGPRNCSNLSPATWDGSTNLMTAARRNAIVTEAVVLVNAGISYDITALWNNFCEPRDPSSTGYPTLMRCDGVVVWVYESVGFNTGDRSGLTTPLQRAPRWKPASVDMPCTTLTETNTSFTILTSDVSSCPTIVQVIWGNGSTNAYWSPLTVTKTASSTIFYRGIDFANHTEDWKQFSFLSTYAAWKTNYFTTTELTNSAVSGDTANPIGDGIPNLMKYALALNPKVNSGSSGLPQRGLITTNSNNYLTLTYRRNASAVDILYAVQASGALTDGAWSTNGVTTVSIVDSNTFSLVTVRDGVPMNSTTCRFMRLRVTKP